MNTRTILFWVRADRRGYALHSTEKRMKEIDGLRIVRKITLKLSNFAAEAYDLLLSCSDESRDEYVRRIIGQLANPITRCELVRHLPE